LRYRPRIARAPLTQSAPYDALRPAAETLAPSLTAPSTSPVPAIRLVLSGSPGQWTPLRDLLGTSGSDRNFVVEVESDGVAYLRFGDGEHGLAPDSGARFVATYRVGNGTAGNVGAE